MVKGDKVLYLPHEIHSIAKDRQGNRPWIFGRKMHRPVKGKMQEYVEELETENEVDQLLREIHRSPNPDEARKMLIRVRPKAAWWAEVKKVNEDGTVDLDVQSGNSGVTLHYKSVPVDLEQVIPHSCSPVPVAADKMDAVLPGSAQMAALPESEVQ